ncbi:MAG: protein kinase [Myxococcales bacterium]|nr:protein kinase [Myxococcales bacterium]MCB9583102.1 protein kinase [Polyangiaceae bacterium]
MTGLSHDLAPGTLLGRYEILAPIADGGMARVWAARLTGSRGFKKTVAIKTQSPLVSDDVRFEAMFLDEARIASRIRHGNVVTILDLGEERELLYLVMEYVDGEPLQVLRRAAAPRGGMPLHLSLKIVADIARGLHAAHELSAEDGTPIGLVHRDVSPQNVLVSYSGAVKVTDFGIAKAAGRVSQTTDRTLKGKPAYMAPEQLDGAQVDRRADVFALGIVLYQLTCGVHPFRGENDLATVKNILSQRPVQRPRDVSPAVDARLEEVILTAIERDPARRFQSAAALEQALDALSRRPAKDEELGALMETLLGDKGRERRQQLEQAMVEADVRARLSPPRSSATPVSTNVPPLSASVPGDRTSQLPSAPGSDIGTQVGYASHAPEPHPRRPLAAFAVFGLALLLGAGVGAWALTQRSTPNAPTAPSGARAPEAPPKVVVAPLPAESAPAPPSDSEARAPHVVAVAPHRAAVPVAPAPAPSPSASVAPPPVSAEHAKPKPPPSRPPVPVMEPGF